MGYKLLSYQNLAKTQKENVLKIVTQNDLKKSEFID